MKDWLNKRTDGPKDDLLDNVIEKEESIEDEDKYEYEYDNDDKSSVEDFDLDLLQFYSLENL